MNANDLRVGLIGTGIMGADHAQTMERSVSGANVTGVADIDRNRADDVASKLRGARSFASAEELIVSPEIDAVIIASSDATHAAYVTACLDAKKPVLCEKPLAPTVPECAEILQKEQALGYRLVQVGFNRRFDPRFVDLRDRVASGVIGQPLLAHCVHRNVGVPTGWKSETTVFSSASHEIDVMPWIFGRPVVRVNWASPVAYDDAALCDPQIVTLELEGGSLVVIELFVTCAYGYEVRCEVVGRSGTLELTPSSRVATRTNLSVSSDFPADWRGRFAESYRCELQAWVDGVRRWRGQSSSQFSPDGPVVGADAWDGYRVMVVAQAVIDSMSRQTPINVPTELPTALYERVRNA